MTEPSDRPTVHPSSLSGGGSNKPLVLLLVAIFCVAFFTSHGSLSVDPPARYLEAKSIVDHQDLRIRPLANEPLPPGIFTGKGGQLYSYFGKGQSVIFAGPYFICSRLLGISSDKLIRSIISLTVFPLFLALTALVFYGLIRNFGFSRRQGYVAATLLVFSTGLWQLSKEGQEGIHLAFFFTLGAYGLRRYQLEGSLKQLALSAVAMGAAFLIRADTAPTVICYFLMAFYLVCRNSSEIGDSRSRLAYRVRGVGLIIILILPALLIYLTVNMALFGNPVSGLTDDTLYFSVAFLPQGLMGLLFSPGKSLFLYNPIMLVAVVGMILLWKRHREWAVFITAAFVGGLLLHAAWPTFHGNCCWGPRYLCRHFGLLFIPIVFFGFSVGRSLPESQRLLKLFRRFAFVIIATVSLLVQVAAVSLHHNRELEELAYAYHVGWSDRQWTMFEPNAHFLEQRLANLGICLNEMIHHKIPPWPTTPDHLLTPEQKLQAPVLRYLAFWPFHLTYYLPAVKPVLAIPLWGAWLILLLGLSAGAVLWGIGWRSCREVELPANTKQNLSSTHTLCTYRSTARVHPI